MRSVPTYFSVQVDWQREKQDTIFYTIFVMLALGRSPIQDKNGPLISLVDFANEISKLFCWLILLIDRVSKQGRLFFHESVLLPRLTNEVQLF